MGAGGVSLNSSPAVVVVDRSWMVKKFEAERAGDLVKRDRCTWKERKSEFRQRAQKTGGVATGNDNPPKRAIPTSDASFTNE